MASFGENLRRERELRGVSLREIADSTKISVRFLEALESGRVEILPGGVFRRAFVREYARYLGLDAERAVADFAFAHGDAADPVSSTGNHAPHRGALVVAAIVLLLVPLLVGKAWRGKHAPPGAAPAASLPPAPVTRVYATPEPPASEDLAASRDGLVLTLSAKAECWVGVRADGATVLNRVLGPGETETVQAHGEILLSVGNAGGIDFRIDDKRGMPLGRPGEVRKNIVITRESLPSLVEDVAAAPPPHKS